MATANELLTIGCKLHSTYTSCDSCYNYEHLKLFVIKINAVGIYTGRFIMFSMITNIYNKKTKGPTLM